MEALLSAGFLLLWVWAIVTSLRVLWPRYPDRPVARVFLVLGALLFAHVFLVWALVATPDDPASRPPSVAQVRDRSAADVGN